MKKKKKKKKTATFSTAPIERRGKKDHRTLLALRINGPNFWSLWPEIQVFCLSCFVPAPVLQFHE